MGRQTDRPMTEEETIRQVTKKKKNNRQADREIERGKGGT